MRKASLRKRLIWTISAISVIVLVLVTVMAMRTGDVIDFGKETSVKSAALGVMDNIDRTLFERYQDIRIFTMSETARSMDPVRLVPYLNDLIAGYGRTYTAMIVVNRKGKVVAANTHDNTGKRVPNDPVFGSDYSRASWFSRAMAVDAGGGCSGTLDRESRTCVLAEDVHEDSQLARYFNHAGKFLTFAAPIPGAHGRDVAGVWLNVVSWEDSIVPILQAQTKWLEGEWLPRIFISLRGSHGEILYSPEGEAEGTTGRWSPVAQTTVGRSRVETAIYSGRVFEALTPARGHDDFRGLGWTTVVQTPIGDAVHDFNQLVQLLAALLVGLAFAFSWWFIRGTLSTFNSAIRQLNQQSDSLKTASAQLTGASQELAQSATEQASSLQETASSIDEINSMINRSAENAERSIRIAGSSQEAATRGKKVVDDMIRAIGEISESNGMILRQIEAGNQQLTEIIKVISEIGNKTKVINDIAFQTKLLSFNASVEAARAGEHGKGFAVVAEEVGSLAQMSGNAAKDIGDMLNGSIQTVQQIVDASRGRVEKLIDEGKSKIDSGIQVARQCESVLEEIVRAEAQMNSIINEIAHASREQAQGMNEITKAVGQLDQVTNRNASIAQQTEEFAEAIARLSKSLKEQVTAFRILMDTDKNRPVAPMETVAAPTAHSTALSEALAGLLGGGEASPSNVIPLRPQSGGGLLDDLGGSLGGGAETKQSTGSLDEVPSESDPRFKEV